MPDTREIKPFDSVEQLESKTKSTPVFITWIRLAHENNVTDNQLLTIIRYALQLHAEQEKEDKKVKEITLFVSLTY